MRLAGIDAGGTTFKLAIGTGPGQIEAETRIPTTNPVETLSRVGDWLVAQGPVDALGIGAFGPVGLIPGTSDHGRLLVTPKPGWSGADLAGPLRERTGLPIALDTDVNAAACAEREWGAGMGIRSIGYITVGTGVGLGLLIDGRPAGGLLHGEGGHIFAPSHPTDDGFPGTCRLHGHCIEGMCSAAAITARWNCDPATLDDHSPAWDVLAHHIGHLAHAAVMVAAVDRVILGGGIGTRAVLASGVVRTLDRLIGGYRSIADARGGVRNMVATALLGDRAGALGALLLARDLLAGTR